MTFAVLWAMMATTRFVRIPDASSAVAAINSSSATGTASSQGVTLRFGLDTSHPRALDAICHARRSMLREEWTLGHDVDEPLLQDALFSTGEIVWNVRPEQRGRCLQKLEELEARVRRWLAEQETAVAT
ncbi:MAG TPA: hypothetical protein VF376_08570 [Thermoanaerobaculia bacterium]